MEPDGPALIRESHVLPRGLDGLDLSSEPEWRVEIKIKEFERSIDPRELICCG